MTETAEFSYVLPVESIAQHPLPERDASRLLVISREDGSIHDERFSNIIEYLNRGDVLVVNNSRVIPARLQGQKADTGGKVEILLLEKLAGEEWRVLVGGRNIIPGLRISLKNRNGKMVGLEAEIVAVEQGPVRTIRFKTPVEHHLEELGHTPLPPYIHVEIEDPERYQTIYSRPEGSAAAPTAGLHFTPELMLAIREKGIIIEEATLHVGLDTFKPVETKDIEEHTIHSEWCRLTPDAAKRINEAKLAGGRIVAVGTTAVRVLETAALRSAGAVGSLSKVSEQDSRTAELSACAWRPVAAFEGRTDLYIYPGYRFRAVDVLLTNFHLPKSSLLLLVSAFAGQDQILSAYEHAVEKGYRFYSFGDAMLIQ